MADPNLTRRLIYRGLKIDLALQQVALRDGTTAEREVIIHRGAVALVPMVDDHHVCLIRNHRYSVGKTLLEVPAGTIDAGETPDQTAAPRAGRGDWLSCRPDPCDPRVVRVARGFHRAHVLISLRRPRAGANRTSSRRAARKRHRLVGGGPRHGRRRPN